MIKSNIKKIENDLNDILKLFFSTNYNKVDINHTYIEEGELCVNCFYLYGIKYYAIFNFAEYYANTDKTAAIKRTAKADLYNILVNITGKSSTFGSVTGIRPVKLYKDTVAQFNALPELESLDKADRYFTDFLKVQPQKLHLIKKTYKVQSQIKKAKQNDCGVYIGIPFCNGKCRYCSFVSADINKCGNLVEPYINALTKEIEALDGIVSENNYNIRSIYIGGGTPSSLAYIFVERILKSVEVLTKNCNLFEYTFEAGRPDSINEELLKLLRKYKVNRISINPQSANDNTLELIGRGHKFEDIKKAFSLAKNFEFIINADIIAGLESENFSDFKNTVNKVLELKPDNITVHTLCLKKGSDLKNTLIKANLASKNNQLLNENLSEEEIIDNERETGEMAGFSDFCNNLLNLAKIANNISGDSLNKSELDIRDRTGAQIKDGFNIYKLNQNTDAHKKARMYLKNILEKNFEKATEGIFQVSKMLEYAQKTLISKGFEPYYVYRQKYSAENLENVGYCKDKKVCFYNVDNMDDTVSILACGANGITKQVNKNNRIERYANPKDIKTYTEKIDEIIENKRKLFKDK